MPNITFSQQPSIEYITLSNAIASPVYRGNLVVTGTLTAFGNSANLVTGGTHYFVESVLMTLRANTTSASNALTVLLKDSVDGSLLTVNFPVPPVGTSAIANAPGYYYVSSSPGSSLFIFMAEGLTAGGMDYTITYGLIP